MAKTEDQPKPTSTDLLTEAKEEAIIAAQGVVTSWRNSDDNEAFEAHMLTLEKAMHTLEWLEGKIS